MKTMTVLRVAPVAFAALLQGCFGGGEPGDGEYSQDLSNPGTHEICSYEENLDHDGYASARMSYPCDLSEVSYPSTTLTGGFTNTKEQMFWLADHLTDQSWHCCSHHHSDQPTVCATDLA